MFAQRASGGANDDVLDDMPVFNEGLARWVERHFDSDGGATPLDRFEGAVVSRRMLVTPGMLTDADRLYRAQGETLRYVLGAALIDALVRRYGASAPRRVLETIGASDFPRGLRGNELWTAAFQLSGFDLALVLDDYTRTLKKWESDYSSAIDELPRVRAVAWKTRGWAGVQVLPDKELPEGWYPAVRFRPTPDSPLRDYRYEWPQPNEIAWEPLTSVANGDICYQVGIGAAGVAIYEPWNCLPLDGAQEMKE